MSHRKLVWAIIAFLFLAAVAFGQDIKPSPPTSGTYSSASLAARLLLKPLSGEFNMGVWTEHRMLGVQHVKFNFDEDSLSALEVVSDAQSDGYSLIERKHPFVFNIETVSINQGVTEVELSWRNPTSDIYYKVSVFSKDGKRMTGFMMIGDSRTGKTLEINVLFLQRGAENEAQEFGTGLYPVCQDLNELDSDASDKLMSLWVTGHYTPNGGAQ